MGAPRIFTPPPGALACANCTAWHPWGDIAVSYELPSGGRTSGRRPTGQCRANPPRIDPDALGGENAVWPVVGAEDWCRNFELRGECEEAA